jgi:hypothetical protein
VMSDTHLSTSEFLSLREVAKGHNQGAIPETDAQRLLQLGLVYKLIKSLHITRAGNVRIARGG